MSKADRHAVIPPNAVACSACGKPLVRAENGWACPAVLGHMKILSDEDVARAVRRKLPRKRPEGMSPWQWGWYRTRPDAWAERIVREKIHRQRTGANK
jgi:hypothetical protein